MSAYLRVRILKNKLSPYTDGESVGIYSCSVCARSVLVIYLEFSRSFYLFSLSFERWIVLKIFSNFYVLIDSNCNVVCYVDSLQIQ